jgi:hypothetical protein
MQKEFRDLGQTAFNMSFDAFREALSLPDDHYARDKYAALKEIGRAMGQFSDSTLVVLVNAYIRSAESFTPEGASLS